MTWIVLGELASLFSQPSNQAAQAAAQAAGGAFTAIARLLAGYLPGVVTLMLVIIGYVYASSVDDPQKATAAKRAIGMLIVGGLLIASAVTVGPKLAQLFTQ